MKEGGRERWREGRRVSERGKERRREGGRESERKREEGEGDMGYIKGRIFSDYLQAKCTIENFKGALVQPPYMWSV